MKKILVAVVVLVLAIGIGTVLAFLPKTTAEMPVSTATATIAPTATATTMPTVIPSPIPTAVSEPVDSQEWMNIYTFGGGPTFWSKCDINPEHNGKDCSGKVVEFYLSGHQSNTVYLTGVDRDKNKLWQVKLSPGYNQVELSLVDDVWVGNLYLEEVPQR
jgi:hypothetical protein